MWAGPLDGSATWVDLGLLHLCSFHRTHGLLLPFTMQSQYAVFGCSNKHATVGEKSIRYFRFPRGEQFRRKWINVCRRSDKIITKNSVVRSEHFTNEDCIDDMKSRLLGIESLWNKRLLKNEAVPPKGKCC